MESASTRAAAAAASFWLSADPIRTASNTVVTPAAASCASLASAAGSGSHCTPGRGVKWRSRWSVCSSTRPGSRWSPSRSTPAAPRSEPMSAIRPSRIRTEPCLTSSSRTMRALLRTVSRLIGLLRCRSLRRDAAAASTGFRGCTARSSNGAPGSASVNTASASTGTSAPSNSANQSRQDAFHGWLLFLRYAVGQGQVGDELVQHIRIAPGAQQFALARRERGPVAAGELGLGRRGAEVVERPHDLVRERVQARRVRPRHQGEEAAQAGQRQLRDDRRGAAGREPRHGGVEFLRGAALGEAERRLEGGVETIAARVDGDRVDGRARPAGGDNRSHRVARKRCGRATARPAGAAERRPGRPPGRQALRRSRTARSQPSHLVYSCLMI